MTIVEKIKWLRGEISKGLSPLVSGDYRLLEVPDYANPGDALILKGELNFLRTLGGKARCVERSTMMSFLNRRPSIPESDLLIFRGGGYFGDLWPMGPGFQREVLKRYPRNQIVIFPQSVCFTSESSLQDAVRRYGEHKNLTICLRDQASYDFVKKHFPNDCRIVPDMAFFAGVRPCAKTGKGSVCIRRTDKEMVINQTFDAMVVDSHARVDDWPVMGKDSRIERIMDELRRHNVRGARVYDWFATHVYCPWQVRMAKRFLRPYESVFTTRLHGGVLALMLGKKVVWCDNSYGKIRSLYDTWLSDCDEVKMV